MDFKVADYDGHPLEVPVCVCVCARARGGEASQDNKALVCAQYLSTTSKSLSDSRASLRRLSNLINVQLKALA